VVDLAGHEVVDGAVLVMIDLRRVKYWLPLRPTMRSETSAAVASSLIR